MKKNIVLVYLTISTFLLSCVNVVDKNLFENKKFFVFNIENYTTISEIKCMTIDSKNNIWVGCSSLMKFNGKTWEIFGKETFGDQVYTINDIDFDSKNNLWVATNDGLFKYDGQKWQSFFNAIEPAFQTFIYSVHCDKFDNVWFSKKGDLVKYDGAVWTTLDSFHGFQIQKIASDSVGNIYIGCFDALYKYDGTQFIKMYYSTENGKDMNVRDLKFDKSQNLWIGCFPNFLVSHKDEINEIETNKVLNQFNNYDNWFVSSLAINNQNQEVVVGTWNAGIAYYEGKNFRMLDGSKFEMSSVKFQIDKLVFDLKNNLWIATRFGKIIIYNEQGIKF